MRTLPHTTTERKAERWLYSWEDCQRDHHTHKKENITGYLHSALFMTIVFFQEGDHMYRSCLIMSPLKGWPVWCSYTYLPGKCWGHIPGCIFFLTQLMRGTIVKLGFYLFCCFVRRSVFPFLGARSGGTLAVLATSHISQVSSVSGTRQAAARPPGRL